jgi:hypothetical protein
VEETLKVRKEVHPRGATGVRKSIAEIVKAVEAGRVDPKTVAWARETWDMAGRPSDKMQLANAILRRLREERGFIEDPVDAEFMVSSACLLEGCGGLTFLGEDCDGMLIAFLSAVEAVGIEGAVVNHAYDPKGEVCNHVLAAVYDRPRTNPDEPDKVGRWVRCDPSTNQVIGTVSKPTREKIYLVPGGKLLCDSKGFCDDRQLAKVGAVNENLRPGGGEFVGVGKPYHGSNSGSVGAIAQPVMGDVSDAFYQMMLDQLNEAATILEADFDRMVRRREEMAIVVTTLGQPLVQEEKENETNWTPELERQYQTLIYMVPMYLEYLSDAVSGRRRIMWDEQRQTILITGEPGEIAFVEKDGSVETVDTTGVDTSKFGQSGQVGTPPVVIGGLIIVGLGLIAVCSYIQYRFLDRFVEGVSEVCETVKVTKAIEWGKIRIDAGEDPTKVDKDVRDLLAESHQRWVDKAKQKEEEGDPLSNIFNVLKMGLYAFAIVGTVGAVAYGVSQVSQMRSSK